MGGIFICETQRGFVYRIEVFGLDPGTYEVVALDVMSDPPTQPIDLRHQS